MKDIEIKEIIDDLYKQSLVFKQDALDAPIRIIQATKSLIGINTDIPLINLLEYNMELSHRI